MEPMELENECGRFWLDEDGVERCVVNAVDQTTAMALDSMRVFAELAGGKRRPVVIDTSKVKALSREVRAIYTGERAARIWTACALVVSSSTVARTVVNFVMAVGRPPFPTRLFDTLDEALAWARSYLVEG
jgi:hypothetical protein